MTEQKHLETQTVEDLARSVRNLQWKVKNLGKQNGRQGQVIHDLRNANDALRASESHRSLGSYRGLLAQLRASEAENARLREKLAGQEGQS